MKRSNRAPSMPGCPARTVRYRPRRAGGAAALLLAAMFLCLPAWTGCDRSGTDSNPVNLRSRAAVYNGAGAWEVSAIAVAAALEDAGREVDLVGEQAAQQSLDDYRVFIVPDGDPEEMADAFGETGRSRIAELVRSGGGYLGIGGGAYLAGDSMTVRRTLYGGKLLSLYEGSAAGPLDELAPDAMTLISPDDPRFNTLGLSTLQVLYRDGPRWTIHAPSTAQEIARFIAVDAPAGVVLEAGFGRVALLAVQPEIEENSDRDGGDWGDALEDGESDWFWLQAIVDWLYRERG
ncbi:MAG TPA: hypothetical protein ENI92_06145 [Bacteroidetes bacterium]|nr:hypothetical protein [Bacteroidota bacterium]